MAAVSATVVVAKIATAVVTDKNVRKTLLWILVIILSPIILLIIAICMLFVGTNTQVSNLVDLSFNASMVIPQDMDEVTKENILSVRESFDIFDNSSEEDVDKTLVKSVFFVLYFENPSTGESIAETFIDNFIGISEIEIACENVEISYDVEITDEQKANIQSVYDYIENGIPIENPLVGLNGFVEPVANWQESVTSEFGYRYHPITGVWSGHGGIDIGKPQGTPVYASLSGTVTVAQYSSSYGYFVMIDHGNGLETLYAHNSKLLVSVGQIVTAGEKISEVGSTGDSTGNHLHFEVRENGTRVNPRNYLN